MITLAFLALAAYRPEPHLAPDRPVWPHWLALAAFYAALCAFFTEVLAG